MSERVRHAAPRGTTLIELMVAMAIASLVVLAATAAFVGSKRLFMADAEAQTVDDTLRFAAFVVKRVTRQAGYADYTPERTAAADAPIASTANLRATPEGAASVDIAGASNARASGTGEGYGSHDSKGVNGSDSLLVRFFGHSAPDGDGTDADGSLIDCMGFAQSALMPRDPSQPNRAWSVFYVAEAPDGEPELYCKYRGTKGALMAQPLARGIEVFKLVYGYDADEDGVPERWLDARQVEAGASGEGDIANAWRRVVAVRVGMVARGARGSVGPASGDGPLYPLGPAFPQAAFQPARDGRLRRVSTFTVTLRNAQRGFSLIVVLLMLLVVTVLAVGAAQLALVSERSARNDRDADIAFQAAEAALSDAERDVLGPNTSAMQRLCLFDARDVAAFTAGCGASGPQQGLCATSEPGAEPAWMRADFSAEGGNSVRYGTFTGQVYLSAGSTPGARAGALPARAPRYVIEAMRNRGGWQTGQLRSASARDATHLFRITAIGFGPHDDTQVRLQTTVFKPGASAGCAS